MFNKAAHALICLALSSGAYAIPIAFEFNPGATSLVGTFKYDFATETYSDINITGIVASYHWGPTDEGYSPSYGITPWQVWEEEDWSGRSMQLAWLGVSALSIQGGTYTGYEQLGCSGGICSARMWEGSVSPASPASVPVSATLTLTLCGLTLLSLTRRGILPRN